VGAVFGRDVLRFGVWAGQHAHHGLGEKGVLEPDSALLDAKVPKVVGDGVYHTHLVLEPGDAVKVGQPLDVLDVGRGYTQGDLPTPCDHSIGAQPSVSR